MKVTSAQNSIWDGSRFGRNQRAVVCLLFLLAAGCTDTSPLRSGGTRSDSVSELRVDSAAVILGSEEPGPELFGRIGSVAVVDSMRIAVVDRLSNEVRVFDWEGEHLFSVGGTGQGPGEFRRIGSIYPRYDGGFFVTELLGTRITEFNRDGSLEGTSSPPRPEGMGMPMIGGVLSNGNVLLLVPRRGAGPTSVGLYRDTLELMLVVRGEESHVSRISTVLGGELLITDVAEIIEGRSVIFGQDLLVEAMGGTVAVAPTDSIDVQFYDSAGGPVGRAVRRGVGRAVDDALVSRYEEFRISQVVDEDRARALRARLHEARYGARLPMIDEMLVDRHGRVWLREFSPPFLGQRNRWVSFDPSGRQAAAVSLPDGFDPKAFLDEWVVGIVEDELGVATVEVRRLRSARP